MRHPPLTAAIDHAFGAVERSAHAVAEAAREEQVAVGERMSAVVADKLAALSALSQSMAGLTRALGAAGINPSVPLIAREATDPALRQRARTVLDALESARLENTVSQKIIHSRLHFARAITAALHDSQDSRSESGLSTPALSSPQFGGGTPRSTGRSLGSA